MYSCNTRNEARAVKRQLMTMFVFNNVILRQNKKNWPWFYVNNVLLRQNKNN